MYLFCSWNATLTSLNCRSEDASFNKPTIPNYTLLKPNIIKPAPIAVPGVYCLQTILKPPLVFFMITIWHLKSTIGGVFIKALAVRVFLSLVLINILVQLFNGSMQRRTKTWDAIVRVGISKDNKKASNHWRDASAPAPAHHIVLFGPL